MFRSGTSSLVLVLLALSCAAPSIRDGRGDVPGRGPGQSGGTDSLSQGISRILEDTAFAHDFLGVMVVSLSDSAVLFEQNGGKLFHPASNLKLLTTATALNLLDSTFQCTTEVFTAGPVLRGTLQGNLALRGRGDPSLTTDDLDSLAVRLRSAGITAISGDLVGDTSYFDDVRWGRGWMWDDEPEADEAFFSPLTVNGNAIEVLVGPGRSAGSRVAVEMRPSTTYVTVDNEAVTSRDTTLPALRVTRDHGSNVIRITGHVVPGGEVRTFFLSVDRPEMYFLHLLRERLAEGGIRTRGSLQLARVPAISAAMVITHPLDTILHLINKPSDNIAAENLLKILSAERFGPPGTSEKGLSLVKLYLGGIGVDTAAVVIADGSGVSAYTIVTPEMMIRLLRHEYAGKATFRRFYESLPIAGVDGTLRQRMQGTAAEGNAHAKTGTLTGVSALSGYVTSADGNLLAFSILANHHPGELAELRRMQDRIVALLASSRTASK